MVIIVNFFVIAFQNHFCLLLFVIFILTSGFQVDLVALCKLDGFAHSKDKVCAVKSRRQTS